MYYFQYILYHLSFFPFLKIKYVLSRNQLTLYIHAAHIDRLAYVLKHHMNLSFKQNVDIVGSDFVEKKYRFLIIYNFLSLRWNLRIFVKCWSSDGIGIPSITPLFSSANWLEREVYDMFGIYFVNHRDLRRILTDYGFDGYPLRKDFPLSGYLEVRYDESNKKICTEPVQLVQEYRYYEFNNPWDSFKQVASK
jgi:NADH dehydrogenase (ubiquinone) Fe-S protein 3